MEQILLFKPWEDFTFTLSIEYNLMSTRLLELLKNKWL